MPLHIETPLVASHAVSRAADVAVRLKLEALQPPGSFKIRGIGAACEAHVARGATRFLSSSGGNAGIAVAHAGRLLAIPVVVVVPVTTSVRARDLIAQEGAELVVHGASWQEAHAEALRRLGSDDALLHPFDDPLLWDGHATMVDEMARQGPKPDAVVVSIGGGGLLSGVVAGLRRNGWSDVPVIAVETEGAASLKAAVDAGRPVALDAITSIATSLGAKQVCDEAFRLTGEHPIVPVVVTDGAAVRACLRLIDDHRLVVEPACGAALAVAYDRMPALSRYRDVAIVVCGGVTATVAQLDAWAATV